MAEVLLSFWVLSFILFLEDPELKKRKILKIEIIEYP